MKEHKFPTPFDGIEEHLVDNTKKSWISVTIQKNTPVYILKGYELFDIRSNENIISKFVPYLTKQEITTTAYEISDDSRFTKTTMINVNLVFKSANLLVLKYEGYTIIVDKQFVHYNMKPTFKIYKHQITSNKYLHVSYSHTNEKDIEIFCNAYDVFSQYKDSNDDNNSYLVDIYKNRIHKCLLKGKHGRVIQHII